MAKATDSIATTIEKKVAVRMMQMLDDVERLPIRSSYNKLTSSYGRCQRDVIAEFKSCAKTANDVYKSLTKESMDIWDKVKELDDNEPSFWDDCK